MSNKENFSPLFKTNDHGIVFGSTVKPKKATSKPAHYYLPLDRVAPTLIQQGSSYVIIACCDGASAEACIKKVQDAHITYVYIPELTKETTTSPEFTSFTQGITEVLFTLKSDSYSNFMPKARYIINLDGINTSTSAQKSKLFSFSVRRNKKQQNYSNLCQKNQKQL